MLPVPATVPFSFDAFSHPQLTVAFCYWRLCGNCRRLGRLQRLAVDREEFQVSAQQIFSR